MPFGLSALGGGEHGLCHLNVKLSRPQEPELHLYQLQTLTCHAIARFDKPNILCPAHQ